MNKKNYVFKSDLVKLIQEQTGLSRSDSLVEANRIILKEESLVNKVFDFAGSAVYSGVIQNFVEQILDEVGIPSNSVLGRVISNFIENLRYDQIQGYLSGWEEGQCEAFMKSLVDVAAESILEYIIDEIFKRMGSDDAGNIISNIGIPTEGPAANLMGEFGLDMANMEKLIGGIIREKLFDVLFTPEHRQEIVVGICDAMSELDFSLEGISKMAGFGGDAEEVE